MITALIDCDADVSDLSVEKRAQSWRDDIAHLTGAGLPHQLMSDLEREMARLDSCIG